MRKVSIIILTWNGLSYTRQCLSSLKDTIDPEQVTVYVVDNGSTDGTLEYLDTLDWIRVIKNGKNLGFVRGNNVAIEQIEGDDIVLMNNDIIIQQKNWLEEFQRCAMADEKNGVIGCRLINEKGEFLHGGTEIYPDDYWGQQIGGRQKDIGQYPDDREVQGVVFAAVYIRREVIDKIGGLNPEFFSYFEDTDYCFRAREAGFKVINCGSVTLVHYQNVSTDFNKVDFSEMFRVSQNKFRELWGDVMEARYNRTMAWHSIMNFPSGYAVSAKNMMTSLDSMGVDIRYKYIYGEGTPFPVEEQDNCDSRLMVLIRKRPFLTDCPQVAYGQGDVFYKNDGKYKIGFTMLETTGIPAEWVRQCNMMNEVWVPSTFNVKTFKDSGVKVPIHVVPLGVDPNYYSPKIFSYKRHPKYTFLSVFEWGERKAADVLLRAFSRAFQGNKEVCLVCKVFNNDGSVDIDEQIRALDLPGDSPDILFLYNTSFAAYDMPSLYRSADCFVLPTRGEGWGMPILEAMACGLPVIATNWSSQTDFFNESNGYPVDVEKLIDAKAKCPYYEGFQWAQPSEEHLIERMRYVYDHRKEAAELGMKASVDARTNWTWDNSARKILERLKEIG